MPLPRIGHREEWDPQNGAHCLYFKDADRPGSLMVSLTQLWFGLGCHPPTQTLAWRPEISFQSPKLNSPVLSVLPQGSGDLKGPRQCPQIDFTPSISSLTFCHPVPSPALR